MEKVESQGIGGKGMQEIKFKIKDTEHANVEIVPASDGVEIVVRYGEPERAGKFKPREAQRDVGEVVDEMKEAARREYKKPGADKEELRKFVEFWERKITKDGWSGGFNFDVLYERWLKNKW